MIVTRIVQQSAAGSETIRGCPYPRPTFCGFWPSGSKRYGAQKDGPKSNLPSGRPCNAAIWRTWSWAAEIPPFGRSSRWRMRLGYQYQLYSSRNPRTDDPSKRFRRLRLTVCDGPSIYGLFGRPQPPPGSDDGIKGRRRVLLRPAVLATLHWRRRNAPWGTAYG